MKKTIVHTKPTQEILDLRDELLQLHASRQDISTRIYETNVGLNQLSSAQQRLRQRHRKGLLTSESEKITLDDENLYLQERHQQLEERLSKIEIEISSLDRKITFLEGETSGLSKAAKAGANGRKNKYAAMKAIALEWYRQERHRFQNKDDAAIEITKTHAVEFSTARDWLKGV